MSAKHPFHELAVSADGKYLFAAVQSSIQKFDLATGQLVATFTVASEPESEKKVTSSTSGEGAKCARDLIVTRDGKHVVAFTNANKSVLVLNSSDLTLVSQRKFPKRPSTLCTSFDDARLLVGDKFGDVYDVELLSTEEIVKPSDGKTEDVASIEPILGHVSMLTDVELVEKNGHQYILSSDRDEHIRVTRYPQAFVVERWLFGHEQFVAAMAVPLWAPGFVISGGGDDFVAVFKWCPEQGEEPLKSTLDLRPYFGQYLSEDVHSAPRRKKDAPNPDAPLEITVDRIVAARDGLLVVHAEATGVLVVLSLDRESGALQHKHTFVRAGGARIVAVATDGSGRLYVSLDPSVGEAVPLLEVYNVSETGEITLADSASDISKTIAEVGSVAVVGEEPSVALYSVRHLRKRGEH
ncbi:uncharacterized protein SAPINGB_P004408 [Magnusiomyces paraingens]|uniref:Uncharacterized protein n=1 Tax=Magnusiomyces paraingens TaxID=2606893 RepID=A0A5E8BUB9_9ASCO|nr:uncharacterized protein SAPINGB_P004408 [Saprochaete ingens]VVT55062.1 unnamed protein product [Saprochaete ingens]